MLTAYESDVLSSISPIRANLTKFKAVALATLNKERRVNIRLSSPDLMDIQARKLKEELLYQTFIASSLHMCIADRIIKQSSRLTSRRRARATKRRFI